MHMNVLHMHYTFFLNLQFVAQSFGLDENVGVPEGLSETFSTRSVLDCQAREPC